MNKKYDIKGKTLVNFLLDETGSMMSCIKETLPLTPLPRHTRPRLRGVLWLSHPWSGGLPGP